MAVLTGVGVLAVLLAVIFYGGDNRPTLPIRQDTNIQGLVAQITKCNRSKGVLTIDMQFLNITDKKFTNNYDQYVVMANSKRYLILRDTDKLPLATPINYFGGDVRVEVGGGGSYTFWAMYPTPPAEVKSISFYTPFTRPFDDVPITDSR